MAVFQVYCDESGKLSDSKCVIFAGVLFRESEVAGFSERWSSYLKDAAIRSLHMKEAIRLEGEFRDWKGRDKDRDALLETLGKLLHDRSVLQVVFTMNVEEFKGLDPTTQNLLKNPVYAGFDGLLKAIRSRALLHNAPNHKFHLVYDLSEEYSVQCLKLFNRMRMLQQPIAQFFPSIAFADDREFPPLQAADMIAYCAREEFLRGVGHCDGIIGKLLEISGSTASVSKTALFKAGRPLGEGIVE